MAQTHLEQWRLGEPAIGRCIRRIPKRRTPLRSSVENSESEGNDRDDPEAIYYPTTAGLASIGLQIAE